MDPDQDYLITGSLAALSISPDSDQVAIAGRDGMLKDPVIDQLTRGSFNYLARSITSAWYGPDSGSNELAIRYAAQFKCQQQRRQMVSAVYIIVGIVHLTVKDAKHVLVTAATNGAIVVWNLHRPVGQKQEHTRAVNRICFHPTDAIMLLSASQDGTMKLWDLRTNSPAVHTFEGRSESVRDVQFNPVVPNIFAASFENGCIQKWDIRSPRTCERKINAHNGLALTIDWHPDGRHLASGGRDKVIKFWDLESDSRKPFHYIQTLASVARVQWRPNRTGPSVSPFSLPSTASTVSAGLNSIKDSSLCTTIASSSLLTDNRIHVWDINRPHVPVFSIDYHTNITTGFQWQSPDCIWSVSKDKTFGFHDLLKDRSDRLFRPSDTMSPGSATWTISGTMAWCNKAAPITGPSQLFKEKHTLSLTGRQRSEAASRQNTVSKVLDTSTASLDTSMNLLTWSGSSVPVNLSALMSAVNSADDSLLETIKVGTQEEDSHQKTVSSYFTRRLPKKSASSAGSATSTLVKRRELKLNLFKTDAFQKCTIEGTESFNRIRFAFFAENYLIAERSSDNVILPSQILIQVCEHNASVAKCMSLHREAETWEILGIICNIHMTDGVVKSTHLQTKYSKMKWTNTKVNLWNFKETLQRLLNWYRDKCDVQMCVYIYSVVKAFVVIDKLIALEWYDAYIEQLSRFKLYVVATAVIKSCPFERIRSMNQESTTVYTTCNQCFKPMQHSGNGYWHCDRCKRPLNPCSICNLPVKTLYLWCRNCSHGGHVQHIQEWFKYNSVCPTGCGHQCVFEVMAPDDE